MQQIIGNISTRPTVYMNWWSAAFSLHRLWVYLTTFSTVKSALNWTPAVCEYGHCVLVEISQIMQVGLHHTVCTVHEYVCFYSCSLIQDEHAALITGCRCTLVFMLCLKKKKKKNLIQPQAHFPISPRSVPVDYSHNISHSSSSLYLKLFALKRKKNARVISRALYMLFD